MSIPRADLEARVKRLEEIVVNLIERVRAADMGVYGMRTTSQDEWLAADLDHLAASLPRCGVPAASQ